MSGADVFSELRIRKQLETDGRGPRLGIGLGVVDGELNLQMPDVAPPEALRDVQGVTMGVAAIVQFIEQMSAIEVKKPS